MVHARGLGRLGLLAVGLGIEAALAASPGIASADDIQISIDGMDLFPTAGNTATATSGMGDIAIAVGANSDAVAEGGFGDFASAFSTGSAGATAFAGDDAAGATGNNFDFASAVGNDVDAAAANDSSFPDTTGSSFDFASAVGGNGVFSASVAEAGFNGSGDSASAVGLDVISIAGASANAAAPANFDSASALGNLTTPTTNVTDAIAGGGITGLGGSNDLAFIVDPFGTVGGFASAGDGTFDLASVFGDNSSAAAGFAGNFDLAAAFGDMLNATATGGSGLVDILPSL
jgi:hypothetical protein